MRQNCPKCERPLSITSDARFCMYCGQRIESTSPPSSDPNETADFQHIVPSFAAGNELSPAMSEIDRVGNYRLIRPLGSGGMGSVYEAESEDSGERVAVKLLNSSLSSNPRSVERFKQEGRLASQISHPRCVFVYGADADAGRPFIVMELMPGSTLKDLVDRVGPLKAEDALARILDVIDGLIEAHRLGVLHRDVKPSNCFLTADDRVKIGDFGLSKSLDHSDADKQLTHSGAFLGTVLFASPEQIRGQEVGYDSDVYSVCATLYYLLVGKAPYQHESITAALARAISEPAPTIRDKQPDVSRALQSIVRRGLDRDRTRRWNTLEELRNSLKELLPSEQLPARTRSILAAYLIDCLVLMILVQIPIELFELNLFGWQKTAIWQGALDPFVWIGSFSYFAILEGLFGMTVGKYALRIRVSRIGLGGPPGVKVAAIRAFVFSAFWLVIASICIALLTFKKIGPILALVVFVVGLGAIVYPMFRRRDFRSWHDVLSGCRIVQCGRLPHQVRLLSHYPNPLELPAKLPLGLPSEVGGFVVRGELPHQAHGERLWLAEDTSLHRRVFLLLKPIAAVASHVTESPVRPTRLRSVGWGEHEWNGETYEWTAYVVPSGSPLVDVVTADKPLSWPDARLLLEQVVEELITAETDGTLPPRLGIDQLWVEATGRIHLLEFPIPTGAELPVSATTPIGLIRQVATLVLEGKPRENGGRILAPLPSHASRTTDKLFDADAPFADVCEVQKELADSHASPPKVTTSMRVVHIGYVGLLSGVGVVLLLAMIVGYPFLIALRETNNANSYKTMLTGLGSAEVVQKWSAASPYLAQELSPERLANLKVQWHTSHEQYRDDGIHRAKTLAAPERWLLESATNDDPENPDDPRDIPIWQVVNLTRLSTQPAIGDPSGRGSIVTLAMIVAGFIAFAFALRGGLSYQLSGISLVTRDGRPAGRFRCSWRECLIWLPFLFVLGVLLSIQRFSPEWFFGRMIFSGIAVGIPIAYAVLGARFPERGPHDRLAKTYPVPM